MKTVIIESPFAGERERNVEYALLALKDCLNRGEAPFASHLLYPLVYEDADPKLRNVGIEAGLAIGAMLDLTAAYVDYGISTGVQMGIIRARKEKRPIDYRAFTRSGIETARVHALRERQFRGV